MNIKYGLIKKGQPPAQRKRILSSAFKEELEEDEEEQDNSGWTGQSKSSRGGISAVNYQITATDPSKYLQGNEVVKSALEEDASVFDYDGNYDKFKTEKSNSYEKAPTQQSARYLDQLMSTSKMRKLERDRVYEKKLLKERKEEDEQFGDKPKFMTAAYKKKLQEDEKWEYEERLQDMIEQKTDVRAKGMQGFYSNLLTKNVAMGGSMDNAVSIYTSGSKRQAHQLEGQEEVPEKETKPAQTEEEAAAVVNKDQVASSSTVKATEEVNPTPDTSNSEPTPDDALARSKPSTLSAAEKVALAKQRYLERKQK